MSGCERGETFEIHTFQVIQYYLGQYENKNPADKNGRTPLHFAASHCDSDVLKFIVKFLGRFHLKDFLTAGKVQAVLKVSICWSNLSTKIRGTSLCGNY